MNKHFYLPFLLLFITLTGCSTTRSLSAYESESLKIQWLTRNTFNHISYLDTEKYGKVPCNGLIFIDDGEAVLFDTPPTEAATRELLTWIEQELKCKVKAVFATHFHIDCLGGLPVLQEQGIASYSYISTLTLAESAGFVPPSNGFEDRIELEIGNKKVVGVFPGPGHTADNIVGYIPSEKVLFGGCLIKSMGAGKGNLDDANVEEWSNSLRKVKVEFGKAKVVVPGHGKCGGLELLDFTIEKFTAQP